jgi:hypothetical protein
MRNRISSRWIPLVTAVSPDQFRLSDELMASAGPFRTDQDDLREFVAHVVTTGDVPAQSHFVVVPETAKFALRPLGAEWCRSIQEAKLWTIRIPTAVVEQAKQARLFHRNDMRKTAIELYRMLRERPEAPAALVEPVRACTAQPPSASMWQELERAVKGLLGGG